MKKLALLLTLLATPAFANPVITCAGYSVCSQNSINARVGSNGAIEATYRNRSALAWSARLLGQQVTFDLDEGYHDGYWDGIKKVVVANGGTGYSSPTATPSGTCWVSPTFGTPVVAGGVIQSIPVLTEGIGCEGGVSIGISDATGSGAVAYAVTGGTGNFGIPGEGTTSFLARIKDVTSSAANVVVLNHGANDLNQGGTPSTIKANLIKIWDQLLAAGKVVIDVVEGPIDTGASIPLFTANQHKQILQTNAWRKDYVGKLRKAGHKIYTLDTTPEETDPASAIGAPIADCRDGYGVHPLAKCAVIDGMKLAEILKGIYNIQLPANTTNQVNLYDATYNPLGFVSANPFFASTGGTNNSSCTGNVASGWQLDESASLGTCSASVSSLQTLTFSMSSGTNGQYYQLSQINTPGNYNLSTGDKVFAQCDLEISSATNINWMEMDLIGFDGSFGGLFSMQDGSGFGQNEHYPDSGGVGEFDGHTLTFKTHPFLLTSSMMSNLAYVKLQFNIGFDATSSAGGTFTFKNCGIRRSP